MEVLTIKFLIPVVELHNSSLRDTFMKRKLLSWAALGFMIGAMALPALSFAQTSSSTTQLNAISTLLSQIKALQVQINGLKSQQVTLQGQAQTQVTAFVNNLSLGSSGDDVKALQTLLASDTNIFPEGLITGHFGKATEKAVKRFQKERGLSQVGRVGPKTRELLNKLLENNPIAFENSIATSINATSTNDRDNENENENEKENHPCAIVPPGHLIAPGWLRKHDGEKLIVPACQILPPGIEKKLNHDNDRDRDDDRDDDHKATTTLDTTAPVISSIVTSVGASTTTINWITNEAATSKVYFGTTTPLSISASSTLSISNSSLVNNHSISLSGLATSTTYFFVVESKDSSANTTISAQNSFVTLSM